MENIVLHVYYTGEAGQAKAFAEKMYESGLRASVLAEDGCMQYDYFLPVAGGNTALLLEKWRDQGAVDKHNASENMKQLKALKERFGLTTKIERYE